MAASSRSTATSSPSISTRPARRRSSTVLCSGRDSPTEDDMAHYIAIIEDAGPDDAVGVWFPDLPGCISGGDDVDEALDNASEALTLYAQDLIDEGRQLPSPRTLAELKA